MHAINVALTSMVINPWFDRSRRASENWSGAIKCDAWERGDASREEKRRAEEVFAGVGSAVRLRYDPCKWLLRRMREKSGPED